jgi:hypothetical protein
LPRGSQLGAIREINGPDIALVSGSTAPSG